MQTIFRLEARWTGGHPPAAVAAALEALPQYDGDALMAAVRALSPAAMHTGFLLHELRDRCELRRVRRDEHLWRLELRGPADGQADVCCVLDFLDALGFRHVSVAGPDDAGAPQVLTATLWRQRFLEPDIELLELDEDGFEGEDGDFEFDDDPLADDAGADDGGPGDDGVAFPELAAGETFDGDYVDVGDERLLDWGPIIVPAERQALRALFASLAAVDDGSVRDALATFALIEAQESARQAALGGAGDPALQPPQGAFLALARDHGEFLDGDGVRALLYSHYAGLAAQGLDIGRYGTLAVMIARAGQFTRVLHGLLGDPALHGDGRDLSGLVGIARAAGSFHLLARGEPLP